MQVYLGGPMFTAAEKRYNLWLAGELRETGYAVYCPNESEPINDKSRDDITGPCFRLRGARLGASGVRGLRRRPDQAGAEGISHE